MATFDPPTGSITVFTTLWCGFCKILKYGLNSQGVTYSEVDIDSDPEAVAFVMSANNGNQTVPTVLFADGSTLTNPTAYEVTRRLG